ncbi:MAG: hypothetical protein H7641_13110, partial [Candidatus Heimdallarchaeota archaeon]|nr:hypothetical protein [Candidatus Heimdallarchaeota archaeon]MCK4878501.1 hypothetical protein [Candidatus Heimdallarchaeota archaeon]
MRRKEIISGIIIATLLITSSKQINTVDLERTFFTFTNLIPSEDYQNSSMKLKLNTLHEPIFISNDGNFTDYGFPGSGSKANPYRIENLNITTDFSNGITINSTS